MSKTPPGDDIAQLAAQAYRDEFDRQVVARTVHPINPDRYPDGTLVWQWEDDTDGTQYHRFLQKHDGDWYNAADLDDGETYALPDDHTVLSTGYPSTALTANRMALFVDWSRRTFGPTSMRTDQLSDHIRKELDEIAADPTDAMEWVDVMILAFDGAWRSLQENDDHTAAARVLSLFQQKIFSNFSRTWPDWRTADPTKAVEHIRDES